VSRHRRSGVPLSVLFCDLDEFKQVNDRLGHNAGDQLLGTVAERLRTAARDVDTVVRIGGDEFALIVEGTPDVAAASAVIDRLQSAVEQETVVAGERMVPAISVGGALLAPGGSPDELLHEADLAMYAAKARRASHQVNVVGPAATPVPGQRGSAGTVQISP
jgi:diguanylate cyclase (GGDEF)-like protein